MIYIYSLTLGIKHVKPFLQATIISIVVIEFTFDLDSAYQPFHFPQTLPLTIIQFLNLNIFCTGSMGLCYICVQA